MKETPRAAAKRTHRDELIDIFAVVYGFTLPLREFQRMAVDQIDHERIDAILAAGWEPSGYREKYEQSQATLATIGGRMAALLATLEGLADEWQEHGFGQYSGKRYADAVRALTEGWDE